MKVRDHAYIDRMHIFISIIFTSKLQKFSFPNHILSKRFTQFVSISTQTVSGKTTSYPFRLHIAQSSFWIVQLKSEKLKYQVSFDTFRQDSTLQIHCTSTCYQLHPVKTPVQYNKPVLAQSIHQQVVFCHLLLTLSLSPVSSNEPLMKAPVSR